MAMFLSPFYLSTGRSLIVLYCMLAILAIRSLLMTASWIVGILSALTKRTPLCQIRIRSTDLVEQALGPRSAAVKSCHASQSVQITTIDGTIRMVYYVRSHAVVQLGLSYP